VKIRVFPRVLRLACLPVLYPCLRRLPMGREGLSQRRQKLAGDSTPNPGRWLRMSPTRSSRRISVMR